MTAKAARMMVEGVSLWCPDCWEFIPDPLSGSSIISGDGSTGALRVGTVVACMGCGQQLRVPASFARVGDHPRYK